MNRGDSSVGEAHRDYEGVSTAHLAQIINHKWSDERCRPDSIEHWAETHNLTYDQVNGVLKGLRPWTGLSLADRILTALDVHLSEMVVIPKNSKAAAKKMAANVLGENASAAEINAYAESLLDMREQVLGKMTPQQEAMYAKMRDRGLRAKTKAV